MLLETHDPSIESLIGSVQVNESILGFTLSRGLGKNRMDVIKRHHVVEDPVTRSQPVVEAVDHCHKAVEIALDLPELLGRSCLATKRVSSFAP